MSVNCSIISIIITHITLLTIKCSLSNALEAKYADRAKLVQSFAFHLFHHEDAIFSFKSHASPHDDLSCPTGLLEVATSKFKESST